jgi:hypothetical protein
LRAQNTAITGRQNERAAEVAYNQEELRRKS